MDRYAVDGESRPEDEIEAHDPGSTYVLTADGWEVSDYIDPGEDWSLLPDGSWLSPDGRVRTRLLIGPEPEVG